MALIQEQECSEIPLLENSDGVLVQQALAGNQSAFEELVQQYSVPLFNFIFHFVKEYDLACDVLSDLLF